MPKDSKSSTSPARTTSELSKVMEANGYHVTKQTRYVIEFSRAPNDDAIYIKADLVSALPIHLVLYPGRDYTRITNLSDVRFEQGKRYFNSNMGKFPKVRNKGKTDIPHGVPITVNSMVALDRVMRTLAQSSSMVNSTPKTQPE